jgi:Domain of unknown function (DUF4265)
MMSKSTPRRKNSPGEVSALLVLQGARDVENIWLKRVKGNTFEVRTIPFWAYNLSFGDKVEAAPDEDGDGLFINRVVEKGGNRTVRIAFNTASGLSTAEAVKLRKYLDERGLEYEIFEPTMLAVNIPSEREYEQLVERLQTVPSRAKMIAEDGDPQPNRNLDGSRKRRSSSKRR